MKLYWNTPEDIAEQLFEAQPETDPLSIRFTDLLRWVTDLEDFSDDPQDSSEGKLEATTLLHIRDDKILTILLPCQQHRLPCQRKVVHHTFSRGPAQKFLS